MSDVTISPESSAPGIASATAESAAVFSSSDTIDGAPAVLPFESAATHSALVDWDHKGRVTRSRFSDGQICQFRYDEDGALYGFIYAKLAWSSTDKTIWSAQDTFNSYVIQGSITVNVDGTLSIERPDFTRTLKLNGMFIDDYRDGNALETMRPDPEQRPSDLFAESHKKNGVPTRQDFAPLTHADLTTGSMNGSADSHNEHAGNSFGSASCDNGLLDNGERGSSIVERSFVANDLRSSQQFERARLVARHAADQSGVFHIPSAEPPTEAPPAPAVEPATNRRPLAVGKRMNRLRVVEDDAAQRPVSAATENPRGSIRLTLEEFRLSVLEQLVGAESLSLAPVLDALAEMYYQRRRVNDAREAHERALSIRTTHLGSHHADTTINLHGLGRIYHEWGRYTEAEEQYAQAIRVSGKGLQKARFMRESGITNDAHILEHIDRLLSAVYSLAKLYSEQQRRHLCVELLNTATNIRNSIDESYHKHFEQVFQALSALASADHADSKQEPAAYTRRSKVSSA
jgi:tetratricopeptide (TPR) repeat protein